MHESVGVIFNKAGHGVRNDFFDHKTMLGSCFFENGAVSHTCFAHESQWQVRLAESGEVAGEKIFESSVNHIVAIGMVDVFG